MALNYAKLFNRRVTPQSRPIPGSTQVANLPLGFSGGLKNGPKTLKLAGNP